MASSDLRSGDTFDDRFRLRRELGSGGFGAVWLAHDETGGEDVALKILHQKYIENPWVLDRFSREAEALSRLSHPNIARLTSWKIADGVAYLAMQKADGQSLAKHISNNAKRGTHDSPTRVLRLMSGLAKAIDYAHGQNVIHRDLKPTNVHVHWDGDEPRVKILDFGVAKILDDPEADATTVGRLLGSLLYMSPEQVVSGPIDGRADIFALGTLLFEILTLTRAWAWDERSMPLPATGKPIKQDEINNHMSILRRIASGERPLASASRPDLSRAVDEVIGQAMDVDPENRFATAADFVNALEAAFDGEPRRVDTLVDDPTHRARTIPDNPNRARTLSDDRTTRDLPMAAKVQVTDGVLSRADDELDVPTRPEEMAAATRSAPTAAPTAPKPNSDRSIFGLLLLFFFAAGALFGMALDQFVEHHEPKDVMPAYVPRPTRARPGPPTTLAQPDAALSADAQSAADHDPDAGARPKPALGVPSKQTKAKPAATKPRPVKTRPPRPKTVPKATVPAPMPPKTPEEVWAPAAEDEEPAPGTKGTTMAPDAPAMN